MIYYEIKRKGENYMNEKVTNSLENLLKSESLEDIRDKVNNIRSNLLNSNTDNVGLFHILSDNKIVATDKKYIIGELNQICETKTLERTKYYIKRLIKSFSEIRSGKINDLNLNRWKEYEDVITDSLWIFNKRDRDGGHNAGYWGNFIPQIPNQFLRRYTKKGEWVLDPFLGSGTTLIECKRLGRNGVGVELLPEVVRLADKNINKEKHTHNIRTEIVEGDSTEVDFEKMIARFGIKSVQFLIMHPPYWDIIKFSEDERDLSNAKTMQAFLKLFGKVVDKTYPVLDKGRYFAVVIGDKYSGGEWIPLSFYSMQEVLKRGYKLKSIIVKNFEETKGKQNQKELWRYRALVGGFYIFKHEYILLFKK